uniref:Ig-like domain-containing protein n=1 Tax=Labrus bergylta TaxID=56723 RepID=A0A3Q3LF52_9LABR
MICVSTGVHCIDLITPGSMVVQPGQSLTLTCQVSGYSLTDDSYATGWIRQREGKPMDWISHQWGTSGLLQNNALKIKFSYSRDTSAATVTLTGQNMQPEDTAVYYCARLNKNPSETEHQGTEPFPFLFIIHFWDLKHKLHNLIIYNNKVMGGGGAVAEIVGTWTGILRVTGASSLPEHYIGEPSFIASLCPYMEIELPHSLI